jgi:biopolymer transport protein ExbB
MTVMSVGTLFLMGGPVMWPLLLCSVFALAIVIEKMILLRSFEQGLDGLRQSVFTAIRRNDMKAALQACDGASSPAAAILRSGVLKYGGSAEEIDAAMDEAARFEIPLMEERLPALFTISQVAPLLGLLGTVTGLCSLFYRIQIRAEAMNPVTQQAVSAGMWQALIATAAALSVAIFAYAAYAHLMNVQNRYVLQAGKAAVELRRLMTHISETQDFTPRG